MISMRPICRLQPPSPPLAPTMRRGNGKTYTPKPIVTLDAETSTQQRDEMLGGLASITSFDEAAAWAKRIIPVKNTLTAEHSREVEAALETKLRQMDNVFAEPPQALEAANEVNKQNRSTAPQLWPPWIAAR